MAKSSKHLIIIESHGKRRKFAKLLFTGDGSYSLTAPYHSAKKAVLSKMTVNYDTNEQIFSFGDAIELCELDEGRLKITHHRSSHKQGQASNDKRLRQRYLWLKRLKEERLLGSGYRWTLKKLFWRSVGDGAHSAMPLATSRLLGFRTTSAPSHWAEA